MAGDDQLSGNGFLEETRAFWERRLGRPVSLEDAREMVANVTAYFRLLQKWEGAAGVSDVSPTKKRSGRPK